MTLFNNLEWWGKTITRSGNISGLFSASLTMRVETENEKKNYGIENENRKFCFSSLNWNLNNILLISEMSNFRVTND